MIPVLQQLLEQNRSTEYAYLCVSTAQHIWKLEGEGSFCGYRNIQMLASCVVRSGPAGARLFGGQVPDIFALQDLIEDAWDRGINAKGRIETGGIRGTRKFIGTPEVGVFFLNSKFFFFLPSCYLSLAMSLGLNLPSVHRLSFDRS